jgi:hypothetical protein
VFWLARLRNALVLKTGGYVTAVRGAERLTGVQVTFRDGRTEEVSCDTLILSGDFVPEYEVALRSGLLVDAVTKGPAVDATGRTSRVGIFAAGSLVHPGWQGGSLNAAGTAAGVRRYLESGDWPRAVEIVVQPPLEWVAPAFIASSAPDTRFVLNTKVFREAAVIVARQSGRELSRTEVGAVEPDAPFSISGDWSADLDPRGGPVSLELIW